jgi:Nif-specific regulatory protein
MSAPASTLIPPAGAQSGEVRELSTLLETSQALSSTLDFKGALRRVLEILGRHHGAVRSTVMLLNDTSGEIELEASAGTSARSRRVRDVVGEGMRGRVLETGQPLVIPRVSRGPGFLQGTARQSELATDEWSYVSAPIVLDGRSVGAIGIDVRFQPDRDFERAVKFLGVVGSMIAQALKMHRLIETDRQRLVDENAHLRLELKERYDYSNLVGTSGPMRQVYEQIAQVARANTTVLLRGESGTGKELIAHAIHYNSARSKKSFIKVSCSALPQDLIESELFGYERGAFTGAHASKKGRFELADGGTLFLDEIGDVNVATQTKLLRVLQEREFERLGGTRTIRANIRLVVATNKDLESAIAAGEFREDLFYRLNVFTIFVPPLRERKPDVLLLADYFLEKFAREHQKEVRRISTPAIDMLTSYHWPGNVRELANVIERAVVLCDAQVIHSHHLPPTLQTAEASDTMLRGSLQDLLDGVERDALQDALKSARGNRAKAARLLGTTERIFNYRVRKHGIDWRRFRP